MATPPIRRNAVQQCLQERGPMSVAEIAEHTGMPQRLVENTISTTRWKHPGEYFRAVAYRPVIGRRARDEWVFAAEAGTDAPRRNRDQRKRNAAALVRYRKKHAARISAAARKRNAAKKGKPVVVNLWEPLAHPSLRSVMTQAAANTSMRQVA